MHGFWKTWMTVWCWAALAFGVVLAAAAVPAIDAPAAFYFELVSGFRGEAALATASTRFAAAVLGAVMIGWALTMLTLLRAADAGAPVWRGLTTAVVVWYAIDSPASVLAGYPLNALTNTAFLATFLAPVIASGVLRPGRSAATA